MGLFLTIFGIFMIIFIGFLISDHIAGAISPLSDKVLVFLMFAILAFMITGIVSIFVSGTANELQSCEQITLVEIDDSATNHYYLEVGENTVYYAYIDERGAAKAGSCTTGRAEVRYVNDTPTLFIETYGLGEKGLKWFWNIVQDVDYCFYVPGPNSIDTSLVVNDLIR